MIIHRYKGVSRLAVLHIVVTNLCVLVRIIIIETEEQYGIITRKGEEKLIKIGKLKCFKPIIQSNEFFFVQLTIH